MSDTIPAESLLKTICYYYLIFYCPQGEVSNLKKVTQGYRKRIAKEAGMKMADYFNEAAPEVSHHIVAFHQHTRNPDDAWVDELTKRVKDADKSPGKTAAFQELMLSVARLPQRAKPENRLHHRRGCQFCAAPCHYGYFTLISEPDFDVLQGFLDTELGKAVDNKKPITSVISFALTHIIEVFDLEDGSQIQIYPDHLSNLAYCLLTLGSAKSRLALPEEQLKLFQEANLIMSYQR